MCLLACFLVVQYFCSVIAQDINVMFVHHHDGIKVLELWNLKNVYCGEWGKHEAYRNDYIDNVDLDCIEKLTVRIFKEEGKQLVLEYSNITSRKLGDYLSRIPDSVTSNEWVGAKVPPPTDQYLVNEGKYEFRWLNENGDKIFAAFYYDSSAKQIPKFYYSKKKEGAEPDEEKFSDMNDCHDIRVSLTVQNIDKCYASNVNHSTPLPKCPDLKPPTVTSTDTTYTEDIGSNVTLNCEHKKINDPVTRVEWLFQNTLDNTQEVQYVQITNLGKYGGSTVASPSLIIYNIMPADIGKYTCQAFTDYALKPGYGTPIDVQLHDAPLVIKDSISQYEFEVGDDIQLPCAYEGFPLAIDVKWLKDSNIIPTCNSSDSDDFAVSGSNVDAVTRTVLQADLINSARCEKVLSMLYLDLMILNAEISDSGIYKCCVNNTVSEQCGNEIIVGYKPIVEMIPDQIIAIYQTRHTLECSVQAFPNITAVEWNITTDTVTKIFPSNGNNIEKYFGSTLSSPSLDILSANFTDTGQYICTAENIFGKTSSSEVDIRVYGISMTVSSSNYTIVNGNDVQLECSIIGKPDITKVTWSMQNETEAHHINLTNILKYNGSTLSSPSLTIYKVSFEDDGVYYCQAGNGYANRTSQAVTLTVTSVTTDSSLTTTTTQNPETTSHSTTSTPTQNPGTTSRSTTSTPTRNPGTTSRSTTSTPTRNPGTTSRSTTSTPTRNPGTTSRSTTSTPTRNPGTTSRSTTSTPTRNPGTTSRSTTSTPTRNPGTTSRSTTSTPTRNPGTTSRSTTSTPTRNPGTTSRSTTSTPTRNPGTTSRSTTSTPTRNPGTTSRSTTSTPTQNPGTTSRSTTSTSTQNPGTTSSLTTSTPTQNPETASHSTTSTSTQNAGTASQAMTSTTTQIDETSSSSRMLTTFTTTKKTESISCQCPCSSLGFWARQDLSNYTVAELLEMMGPQLAKLEKELSVDKSNLSATINKRISAKDDRKSSQSIGIFGIVFIVSVILCVVIIDLMSFINILKPKLKRGKTDTSEPEQGSE